jgi:chromate transporter
MRLETFFGAVFAANLIGFGGLSSLPIMRGALQSAGLPADAILLRSLSIANVTPGPTGLYLVVVGFFVFGLAGATVAVAALILPPALVLVLERAHGRLVHHRRFRAVMFALSLSVLALLVLSASALAQHAGTDALGVAMIVFGVAVLLLRVPPIAGFLLAGAIGYAFG